MPYTISHVAAVMPFHRWLSREQVFSAAVIGSMLPDFRLLLPRDIHWETHTGAALVTFCLPAGLVIYWLTQLWIRPAVLEVLPNGAYTRLRSTDPASSLGNPGVWLLLAGALLFGAATHLAWDGFTHENALGVRSFPFLTDFGPELDGHRLHLWRWLQFGSSVAGLVVIVAALIVWLRHAPAPAAPPSRRMRPIERVVWRIAYLLPPIVAMGLVWWGLTTTDNSQLRPGARLEEVAIASIRGAATSLLLVSTLIQIRIRVRLQPPHLD